MILIFTSFVCARGGLLKSAKVIKEKLGLNKGSLSTNKYLDNFGDWQLRSRLSNEFFV